MSSDTIFPLLAQARDRLTAVDGVASCKIGREHAISPADYPLVRLVLSRIADAENLSDSAAEVQVFFGVPIHESADGLEAVYAASLDMRARLLDALQSADTFTCMHHETIADEDKVEAFKMYSMRVTIEG